MPIITTPEVYFHRHILNTTPNLTIELNVDYQQLWHLFNDPSLIFTINGENIGEFNGGGNMYFTIGLTNAVNNLDAGLHEKKISVFSASNQESAEIIVYLMVSESEESYVFPESMDFESIRNVQMAAQQSIYIATTDAADNITVPSFLILQENEIVGNGRILKISPEFFASTPEKNYSGEIVLEFPGFTKIIPVTYVVHAGYDDSYSKPVHFTCDNDELVFYKTTPEKTFLRLATNIKSFGYDGLLHDEISIPLDLPFVNNHAKINIGKELEPYFAKLDRALQMLNKINGVYPPMEVSMTAMELLYSDFSIVNQDIIPVQHYLKGRKPYGNTNAPFWLAFRPNVLRYVTLNSSVILQVFKPALSTINKVNLYVNGEFRQALVPGMNSFNFSLPYFLYTTVRLQSIPGIKPGDHLEFEYEGLATRRNFVVKPPQPFSFLIAYETIWGTMDVFEFTAPASFSPEYTQETSRIIRNYVEVESKIDSSDVQKVTINSGWVFKEEAYFIDEIIRSKKAFLLSDASLFLPAESYVSENYGNIELVPVSTKIINFESDRNLISFDVEFIINKRHADEIYSR